MQKRHGTIGAALFGAIAFASSIGPAAAADKLTLLAIGNEVFLKSTVDAFNAANPDVQVVQEIVPFDTYSDIVQTRLGTGDKSLDVIIVDQPRSSGYAARGFLTDLTQDYLPEAKGKLFDAAI